MPYYAVARGRKIGIFQNWDACKAQVTGFPSPIFKKFATSREANDFLKANAERPSNSLPTKSEPLTNPVPVKRAAPDSPPAAKRQAPSIQPDTVRKVPRISGKKQDIYVDGACRGNGKVKTPSLGYGVFYGDGDPRNVGVCLAHIEDVRKFRPTNQRAELHALRHALRQILKEMDHSDGVYEIFTDSKYGKQCIDSWAPKWKLNGWRTGTGQPVANRDLVEEAYELFTKINKSSEKVKITHVRGHAGIHGNEEADRLANYGCDLQGNRKR